MTTPQAAQAEPLLPGGDDDERLAVEEAEAGDQTRLVELLQARGLGRVAGLHVRHRLVRRKRRGRPPIPGSSVIARALAEGIERWRHLSAYPRHSQARAAGPVE